MAKRQAKPATTDQPQGASIAPWPLTDRYPTVLGSNLTLSSISAVFRNAQSGYRQDYVDVLDELLEREPHGFAVLSQRILATAGGRIEVTPAKTESGTPEEAKAREIADLVDQRINAIPALRASLASLLWALYYGVSCSEITWSIDANGWYPARLHFVHTRRLSYPDPNSWDLHIWDQGASKSLWTVGLDPTTRVGSFGIDLVDFPGKFIVHTPQLRGDYPTRDGLGRELAYWFALKGIAARGAGQYVERFGKPWVIGTFTTNHDVVPGNPRAANDDDIARGQAATAALGIGSLASAMLPDSVKITIDHPTGGISHKEFIDVVDNQITKAVLCQTLTTSMGSAGSRAAAETHKDTAKDVFRYDAACLADTLRSQLVGWIVKLNYPDDVALTPTLTIHVDEKPDPIQVMTVAKMATDAGMPVDADDLAERLGLKLVDPTNPDARRLATVLPIDLSRIDPTVKAPEPAVAPGATSTDPEADDEDPDAGDSEDEDEAPSGAAAGDSSPPN